jgi:ribosomal peptide maturation radical SAM protein 1
MRSPHQAGVCLVSMPYASLSRPSMALGLLAAILDRDGISATVVHAGLWFAESAGLRLYELCASRTPTVFMAGEWTFAAAAFPDEPGETGRRARLDAEYLRQVSEASEQHPEYWRGNRGATLTGDLSALRDAAIRFTDETARRVLATGARVVGCTSTFEQHVASLALLRRIRELDPSVVTMLGGANCETVMGQTTHRCFPWVDYVVSGEADGLITTLCRLVLAKGRDVPAAELPRGVLGPAHRDQPSAALPRVVFQDLDSLPTPRFDEYFAALAESGLRTRIRPGIPVETSRGCWWGAVHQCTFCGLNGTGMGFRSKSPSRVIAELDQLQHRYGIGDFEAVDNILDNHYYKSLLPDLAEVAAVSPTAARRRIFFEIKANVTSQQVEAMVSAGVTWVQPGIESLHSDVLRLMDKGIQGWQNVQLLKWARQSGLRLSWSLLWGFPGEKDDWYLDMSAWFPALEHLQPPAATPKMRFDRYSVYHEHAQRAGLILFPLGSMAAVYPVSPADLDGLAYFFSTEPGAGPLRYMQDLTSAAERNPGIKALIAAARAWRAGYNSGKQPMLLRKDLPDQILITDSRSCARQPQHVLAGLAREVYLACDAAPRRDRLAGLVGATEGQIEEIASRFAADRLALEIDGRLVALALTPDPRTGQIPPYPDPTQFPGGHVYATAEGPGQSSTAAAGPGQSSTAAAGPGQSSTAAAGPGQSGPAARPDAESR